jgi:lycopene cyclase domain-containing protein
VTSLVYLLSLVVVLGCMAITDRRWKLFFWADPRRASVVFAFGFLLFLTWDVVALHQQLYERGRSEWMTGIEVAPELPVEELFFLAFLPYLTMVLHGLARRVVLKEGSP